MIFLAVGIFVSYHINLRGLSNAKAILLEELGCFLTHSWGDMEVHTIPKGVNPKGDVIARLEFEHTYYDVADQNFSHHSSRTTPVCF